MTDMRMVIKGIGVVGAFGSGIDALATAIVDGIRPPLSTAEVITKEGTGRLSVYRARTEGLEEFFAKRELRRIDHYAKMALLAASLALKDAKVSGQRQGTTGIIVATGYGPHRTTFGFLDTFVKEGNNFASPTLFASSVHNAAAAYAAILFGERGPSLTVSQLEMSVSSALLTAWCWLAEGRVDSVLFGAVDEYSDVLGYCWKRYFGVQETSQAEMRPLDFERQSAIPGEGSVFFLLRRNENQGRYGCIRGVDMGFADCGRIDLPETDLLFLGADGMRETGRLYPPHLSGKNNFLCHAPTYGSLPIGPAFDIAIAAHEIGDGAYLETNAEALPEKTIGCLKIGRQGEFSLVMLARE
jgi:3-oxoacyl-[acyl-carrier-protein] synthase II